MMFPSSTKLFSLIIINAILSLFVYKEIIELNQNIVKTVENSILRALPLNPPTFKKVGSKLLINYFCEIV